MTEHAPATPSSPASPVAPASPAAPLAKATEVAAREDDALARLLARGADAGPLRRYGDHPDQVYEWFAADPPAGSADSPELAPADAAPVVLVHGGYFRARTDRTHARPLARALAARGRPVVLAEYRRVAGDPDASVADLRTLDVHLRSTLDVAPRVWAGHSAGGTFVLLRALRGLDAAGAALPPVDVVALAPLSDLTLDARRSGAGSAVAEWIGGGPDARPEAYARLDPAVRLDVGARPAGRLTVIHGEDDAVVPVADSRRAWSPGTRVEPLAGAHHFDVVDPDSPHIAAVYAALGA